MLAVGAEVSQKDSTLTGVVDAYYGGNEFWLSVYQDFNDVRLVFAPPSSVGKFGWDKDNWMWPRHTGDFCVFRIYAGRGNRPADYSPDNVPYHPRYVAPISLEGYQEGDFCMTLGYPGSTERYLSSFGIEEAMNGINQAQIDIRGVKQAIWKRAMDASDDIREQHRYESFPPPPERAREEAHAGARLTGLDTSHSSRARQLASLADRSRASLQGPPCR